MEIRARPRGLFILRKMRMVELIKSNCDISDRELTNAFDKRRLIMGYILNESVGSSIMYFTNYFYFS